MNYAYLMEYILKGWLRPFKYWENTKQHYRWVGKHSHQLRQFENKHEGEDCFIIGNGPSLNQMDLSPLNEYFTFGLNKIFLIFEKVDLKLDYVVSTNELVIEQSAERFEKMVDSEVFVSHQSSSGIPFTGSHIHRIDTSAPWSFYGDLTKPIAPGYTVTFVAMQIAYYMGFRNVYLIGVDHNFNQSGKPNSKEKMNADDPNHFHPEYFKGHDWHLADLQGSEASFALARHGYSSNGRNIYDATVNGKLQVYPKITYEEALSQAKKK